MDIYDWIVYWYRGVVIPKSIVKQGTPEVEYSVNNFYTDGEMINSLKDAIYEELQGLLTSEQCLVLARATHRVLLPLPNVESAKFFKELDLYVYTVANAETRFKYTKKKDVDKSKELFIEEMSKLIDKLLKEQKDG